jgi:hypothetical protein
MELHSLETKNFKPRDNVVEAGTLLTQEILSEIPVDGKAKVVISDQGDSFFFSVVAKSSSRLFSSEGQWKKKETHGWPRDWQITALLQVLRDFARRIASMTQPKEAIKLENENDP